MIKVEVVNMGGLTNLASIPSSIMRVAARNLITAARAKWIKLASERLHSTRVDYIQGIQTPRPAGRGAFSITLVGALPNMVENGIDRFQLQKTLLGDGATGWTQAADGGRYRAIPFRHKTPGAGPIGGQAMGSQFIGMAAQVVGQKAAEAAAFKQGQAIHARAKRLITPMEKAAGKKGRVALPSGLAPKLKAHHTTDIFSGMRVNKQAVQGKKRAQKTYSTFRMIAQGPDGQPRPDGKWLHPGIKAHNLVEEVAKYVEKIAPDVIAQLTKGLQGQA